MWPQVGEIRLKVERFTINWPGAGYSEKVSPLVLTRALTQEGAP
jgi:hypothetical protein